MNGDISSHKKQRGNLGGDKAGDAVLRTYSHEENLLQEVAKDADAQLAAKRAARAEAREIRMREIERQQSENVDDEDDDELLDTNLNKKEQDALTNDGAILMNSMLDDSSYLNSAPVELKTRLLEIEERYRTVMKQNADLDNEKQTLKYDIEKLKDEKEELEENCQELSRETRDKTRLIDQMKYDKTSLDTQLEWLKHQLEQRDQLIKDHGLVYIDQETVELAEEPVPTTADSTKRPDEKGQLGATLVSPQVAELIRDLGEGSLDKLVKTLVTQKTKAQDECRSLQQDVDHLKERQARADKFSKQQTTGPEAAIIDLQREHSKQIQEYRVRIQKAEDEINSLQNQCSRLETQLKRVRKDLDAAEETERDLKAQKRRQDREMREKENTIEELTIQRENLETRLQRLKQNRTTLGL